MSTKHIQTFKNHDNGRRASVVWDTQDEVYRIEARTVTGTVDAGLGHFDPGDYSDMSAPAKNDAVDAARAWVNGHATNTEFLVHIIEWARTGPLMQAFVINALVEYSKEVAAAPLESLDANGMVNPVAWQACAVELRDALRNRHG